MLEATVGEKVLRNGLSKYLKTHKFGNAVTDDLWQAVSDAWEEDKEKQLTRPKRKNETNPATSNLFAVSDNNKGSEVNGFTVKELMDTWTLQTGYPVVTFTQHNDTNIYTIDQQRFLAGYKVDYVLPIVTIAMIIIIVNLVT